MAKLLFIIAPKDFNDDELIESRRLCEAAGHSVTVASTQKGEALGMHGHEETVSHTLDEFRAKAFDGLVIIGGYGAVGTLWDNEALQQLARDFNAAGKLTSAICVSPAVLAKAGVLEGKQATIWEMPESLEIFHLNGVTYTGEPVTQSGHLITGKSPDAAVPFGQALVDYLSKTAASV